MRHSYISIVISLLSVCWPAGVSSEGGGLRVANGTKATAGQFPYQVGKEYLKAHQALRLPIRYKYAVETKLYHTFCGGALIGPSKVLSAAHCFTRKNNNVFKNICRTGYETKPARDMYAVAGALRSHVYFSKTQANLTSQWREINKIIIPISYNFPDEDISVAITKYPFEFNDVVCSLPYARTAMDYGNLQCVVSGFGRISKTVKSKTLMWTYLELIPAQDCSYLHRTQMKRFICTQPTYSDVLQGDSGGPLVCNNTGDPADKGKGVIIGVVSGAREQASSFFTRVTSYKDFIESKATSPGGLTSILLATVFTMTSLISKNWINTCI